MIEKKTYFDSFEKHIKKCIEYSENRAKRELPKEVKLLLGLPEEYENALAYGYLKYLGGRKLPPEKLVNLSIHEVVKFTYVNGKVPTWINLYYEGYDEQFSYVRVLTSKRVSGELSKLYEMPEGGVQFHILLNGLGVLGNGLPENLELLPDD